jgi:hypothetical protein
MAEYESPALGISAAGTAFWRQPKATLLHIDSSVFPGEASSSRSVTAACRKVWEEQHPEGTVAYRDLAAGPVPHITAAAWSAGYAAPSERTPAQSAAFAARAPRNLRSASPRNRRAVDAI